MAKMKPPYLTDDQQWRIHKVRKNARFAGYRVFLDRSRHMPWRRHLRVKNYSGTTGPVWRAFALYFKSLFPNAREYQARVIPLLEPSVPAVSAILDSEEKR